MSYITDQELLKLTKAANLPQDVAVRLGQLLRGRIDPIFTATEQGEVPASGGGTTNFLRADGTWATASGGGVSDGDKGDITVSGSGATWTIDNNAVTLAKLADIATARILGRTTAGSGDAEELTGTQATALLDAFTSALKGLTPASGGGTSNFLRADGSWNIPPGIPPDMGLWSVITDGNVVFDGVTNVAGATLAGGNYTLDRDVFYNSCTIDSGVEVEVDGFRLFAYSLTNNGIISANGSDGGLGTSGGGAAPAGFIGGGTSGGLGAGSPTAGGTADTAPFPLYTSSNAALGGAVGGNNGSNGDVPGRGGGGASAVVGLGNSQAGGNGGILTTVGVTGGGPDIIALMRPRIPSNNTIWECSTGGGGGAQSAESGSNATGGRGGGSGGVIVIVARTLTGSGTIRSNGGNGGNAQTTGSTRAGAGGGGGGGGGLIVLIYWTRTGSLTIESLGGTGGTGANQGVGTFGGNGGNGSNGVIVYCNISNDGT